MGEKEPGPQTPIQEAVENRRAADGLRSLVKTEGFAVLEAALQTARLHWTTIALQPAQSEAGALQSEFAKGAVHGLTLALNIPSAIISAGDEAEADLEPDQESDEA